MSEKYSHFGKYAVLSLSDTFDNVYVTEKEPLAGETNHISHAYCRPAKAASIALELESLGVNTSFFGFCGGFLGQHLKSELMKNGVGLGMVDTECESVGGAYVCRCGETTYFRPRCHYAKVDENQKLMSLLEKYAAEYKYFIISGNIPDCFFGDKYALIIKKLKEYGCKTVTDFGCAPFRLAVKEKPELLYINKDILNDNFFTYPQTLAETMVLTRRLYMETGCAVLCDAGDEALYYGQCGMIHASDNETGKATGEEAVYFDPARRGAALLSAFLWGLEYTSNESVAMRIAFSYARCTEKLKKPDMTIDKSLREEAFNKTIIKTY